MIAGYPEALPSAPVLQSSSSTSEAGSGAGAGGSSSQNDTETGESRSTEVERSDMGPKEMKALEGEALGVGYNSAVIVGPGGKVLGNYRKTFRFDQDKYWAREGESLSLYNQRLGERTLAD